MANDPNSGLPDWASITSDLVDDGDTEETNTPVQPAAPARPQRQVPQAPAKPQSIPTPPPPPAATPSKPVPQPVPVAPVPVAPAPVTQPQPQPHVQQPVAPAYEPEPAPEPEPRQRRKQESTYTPKEKNPVLRPREPQGPPSPMFDIDMMRQYEMFEEAEQANQGKRKKRIVSPTAGGRTKTMVLRGIIWGVLVIAMLNGAKNLIIPSGPNIDALTQQVGEKIGETGFPKDAGLGLALQFTKVYLTFSPSQQDERINNLRAMSAPGVLREDLAIDGKGSQEILTGPFLAESPKLLDETRAYYTIGAQVVDPALKTADGKPALGTWVYLTVTVVADKEGGVSIGGAPGFAQTPQRSTQNMPYNVAQDSKARESLATELPAFFQAWAGSKKVELARFLRADSDYMSRTGLGGMVQLQDVSYLTVSAPMANGVRYAQTKVTWIGPNNVIYPMGYQMNVVQDAEGKWYVVGMSGGTFSG